MTRGGKAGPSAAPADNAAAAAADALPLAPDGLPDAVRRQHTHVTCGVDANFNVREWKGERGVCALRGAGERATRERPPPGLAKTFILHPFPLQTATVTAANAYMALGIDNAWDEASFKERLGIRVTGPIAGAKGAPPDARDSLSFDLVGADAALANALRRVMLSDAPSVAIEAVFIVNNTSIMPCEILAHRLGLVPLALDPALLVPRSSAAGVPAGEGAPPGAPPPGQPSPASEANTVVFRLHVKCVRHPDGSVTGDRVTSGDLEWAPGGSTMPGETGCVFEASQATRFGPAGAAPVHPDILLVKLRPGQEVELEAHAVVGTGAVHAKWSPVSTAWYRLHPEVFIKPGSITGEAADALAAELPGLVKVVGSGSGRSAALAAPARGKEQLLEKARRLSGEPLFGGGALEVARAKDHFIFTVESAGCLPPEAIVARSLDILERKCDRLLERL